MDIREEDRDIDELENGVDGVDVNVNVNVDVDVGVDVDVNENDIDNIDHLREDLRNIGNDNDSDDDDDDDNDNILNEAVEGLSNDEHGPNDLVGDVQVDEQEDDDEDDDEDDEEEEDDEDEDEEEDIEDDNDNPSGAFANVGQGLVGKYKNMMMQYWQNTIDAIERDDHDFKNHHLPLARIKKVMKTDDEVKMISAEAPILFAKGCDIFITELTMRAWIHAEENKRRTLQKSDIAAALQKSDMFDFLIDIVPREEDTNNRKKPTEEFYYDQEDNNEYYNVI